MVDFNDRISTMRGMFQVAYNLNSFTLNRDFELTETGKDYDHVRFYNQMFQISSVFEYIKAFFSKADLTVLACDKYGISWIVSAEKEAGQPKAYYILGPFFGIEASEHYLVQIASGYQMSRETAQNFREGLKDIPTIPNAISMKYAIMQHYFITNQKCDASCIQFYSEYKSITGDDLWIEDNYHGTWQAELKLFQDIRDGNAGQLQSDLAAFASGFVGRICPDDPVRELKDQVITFITLASRAAILGGVSPEGGYNLSDYYLQRLELAKDISSVQNISFEMVNAFLLRSVQAKNHSGYSVPIQNVMEYIENHLYEKINLDTMAESVNYSSYYLSKKFYTEVGMKINDYIKTRKIETAKNMLLTGKYSIIYISDYLGFSSVSYFTTIFKSLTGKTPGEFLENK